jgi:hypothetical protein
MTPQGGQMAAEQQRSLAPTAEIYWTPIDGDGADLIPGHLTKVIGLPGELRIGFEGQDGPQGDRYHGILMIKLRAGRQAVEGKQSYKAADGAWEPVPFSLQGRFEDLQFTSFTGTWIEGGTRYRMEIVGLPPSKKLATNRTRKRKRASKSGN